MPSPQRAPHQAASCHHPACPRTAQTLAEYALLIGMVSAAILTIQIYAKRGIQGGIKTIADRIGSQTDGIRYESGDMKSTKYASGTTLVRETATETTAFPAGTTTQELPGSGWFKGVGTTVTNTTGELTNRGPGVSSYSEVISQVIQQ